MAQRVSINGKVLSSDSGTPIPGVSVKAFNPSRTAVTNDQGNFSISANPGEMLEFSYLGFTTQSVKAANNMQVSLAESAAQLEGVVVTAMGIKKKEGL
ncbi:carboxypeptidase-like regulatory domain-containing protein [Pedobacter sp. UC225_61]|uniref:carboxypeptidase-like regulatory domain-containing protein n=1 Tax=Pedobacter sp. UC225_61 TaxID=3374623 RepID=UPI0037AEC149